MLALILFQQRLQLGADLVKMGSYRAHCCARCLPAVAIFLRAWPSSLPVAPMLKLENPRNADGSLAASFYRL